MAESQLNLPLSDAPLFRAESYNVSDTFIAFNTSVNSNFQPKLQQMAFLEFSRDIILAPISEWLQPYSDIPCDDWCVL